MVAKPGWHLDVRTRGLWPVVVNMSAHAALPKISLERRPNPCPYGFLVTAITWLKTVTFYHADIPWPLLMARSAVLTRTHALIYNIVSAWHEAKKPTTKRIFVHALTIFRSAGKPRRHFFPFILHHLSPVINAKSDSSGICTVSFVVLGSNPMVIHSVIQRLLRNRPGSGRCNFSWLFALKITKCTDSCKPASLNCRI